MGSNFSCKKSVSRVLKLFVKSFLAGGKMLLHRHPVKKCKHNLELYN